MLVATLVGILFGGIVVAVVMRHKQNVTTMSRIPTVRNYSVYIPNEETRLRQALQDGTGLDGFATVEVRDNVAVITATRRVEMRVYNGELILHQFGTRGGAGIEIRLAWYACAEGLAGLNLIHVESEV